VASVLIENVRKEYEGGILAVNDVNVTVADKEFVVLVGPSGCGKSTTLRMIAGLEEITSGTISIDGKIVNDVAPKDRDIAMVFQNYALYPHMTVYENMAFGLKLRKYPKTEIDKRVQEAAQILGIDGYLNRKPKALSGGQRQRVAVGRAIVRKPKVFLFDEPLSNLDAKLRVAMRTEISKLHHRLEATMIYVTHDQTEAMTMGDRIVVMKDGNVQQIDTPLCLYHSPVNKFVAGFIGSPAMNFMDGAIVRNSGLWFAEKGTAISLRIPSEKEFAMETYIGKDVWLGIRPEHIQAAASNPITEHRISHARVEVVEPMGNEVFIYFTTGGTSHYISRVTGSEQYKPGTDSNFTADMSKAHFFEKGSEKVIGEIL
jgi:multiple sugar transport system ATP-binding protein